MTSKAKRESRSESALTPTDASDARRTGDCSEFHRFLEVTENLVSAGRGHVGGEMAPRGKKVDMDEQLVVVRGVFRSC